MREKAAVHSELDDIQGLFQKNKKLLIDKYGSVAKISKQTKEDLMLLLSKNQASLVYNYFNNETQKIKQGK